MHRIRFITSAIALLALVSFAVADAPRVGAGTDSSASCPLGGQACPPECRPCPEPCQPACASGEAATACAVDIGNMVR